MVAIVKTYSRTLFVCLGTALLFVAAQIQIPLHPVPITLQTLGVMILGLLFDRKSAIQAVLLYLGLGVLGLPVFAGFSNIAMVGSRVGYLVGFLAAVWVMTYARERLGEPKNIFELIGLNLFGSLVIFVCGVAWLSVLLGFNNAISVGFMPFVVPGLVKAVLLSGAIRFLRTC